jgi:hypothetical protein
MACQPSDDEIVCDCEDHDGDGFSEEAGDCDDANPTIHPAADDNVGDALDNNCDGIDGVDDDGDGVANLDSGGTDCNDVDPAIYPEADETCDRIDNNCNDEIDEGLDQNFYADADGDGHGSPDYVIVDCEKPFGYVETFDDCDDLDATTNPDVEFDFCNNTDNDCDGFFDEDSKADWNIATLVNEDVYVLDKTTGEESLLISFDDPVNASTVATYDQGGVYTVIDGELLSLNICEEKITTIGDTGSNYIDSMSFGGGGELYGIDTDTDQFQVFNLSTGYTTPVGVIGFDAQLSDLAYDCTTETMWGVEASSNSLYELDVTTGKASYFRTLDISMTTAGLEYDPQTGMLIVSTGSDIYEVNPYTAESALMGSVTAITANDISLIAPCD